MLIKTSDRGRHSGLPQVSRPTNLSDAATLGVAPLSVAVFDALDSARCDAASPGTSPSHATAPEAASPSVSTRASASFGIAESARVPEVVAVPRSALSSVNRLFRAAEGFDLMRNPLPGSAQDTVSVLGAGFAAYNIGAEFCDRDWLGALEDTAGGSVSLLGGVKMVTDSPIAHGGLSLVGATLNAGFAARDALQGRYFDASVKFATATGLSLTAFGGVAQSVGLAVLGFSGLIDLANDHLRDDAE